ncbi:hypothetical protein BABINDRAFT_37219 [Babjeviella inositovora NRRL Y-12698]|uniref:5-formyltetrahydrofolate cyclo-ligase n=1 Tax=Babjeviella inositovora NRRL Y-12698 TaxID=984486 RepID=A0A1E3QP86_9ASCO|nr:uncharacterized protein BABINDRAFT_37219 [Babjeviella inositovora NRRL Y-12698]ODQ79495.1 hypothetical protein BABINDRAFT_37219 [Babjeviella inositovora NRRL Y-12698]
MPHSEIQTMPLVQNCFADGKKVFLPRCTALKAGMAPRFAKQKAFMEMIRMPNVSSVQTLTPHGPYKLLEPTEGQGFFSTLEMPADTGTVDLIILPGVAFTKKLQRMGHGAGFYDDFIKRYRELPLVQGRLLQLVAVGLKEQLVESIPVEEHDETLDGLVIDGQWFE